MARYYGDLSDLGAFGYGAWYDDVINIARNVIPAKTVVGKIIGSPAPVKAEPIVVPQSSPLGISGLPSWVLPVAIGVGAILVFKMMSKPRGRRR